MRRLLVCLPVLALLAGCSGSSEANQDSGPPDRGTNAWVMCEEFVKDRMGSDDLDFGGRSDTTIKGQGKGPYTVASTVEGDPYRCHIETDNAGDRWTLVDLTVAR